MKTINILIRPFCLILSMAITTNAYGADNLPTAKDILRQTRDTLSKIHTATYDITTRQYNAITDSFYMRIESHQFIECENPADTAGNAIKIVTDMKTGKFLTAYDGNKTYWMDEGYIRTNIPSGFNGVKTVRPPFFNHATSLADYLLTPNPKVETTVEDYDSYWIIDAKIREFQMITFFGKPYQMPSLPDVLTLYRMRINKNTMLPDRLDYYIGWPQQRWVEECSNVTLNPFPLESFSVTQYLPDLPHYDYNDAPTKKSLKKLFAQLKNTAVPNDTLAISDGTQFSISDYHGKPVFLMCTSTTCGPCIAAYPVLKELRKDYADYGLEFIGVMYETQAQPEL